MFIHDKESQDYFDSFNRFIFSSDIKLLGKIYSKFHFLERTKDLPGDIFELGVFKGSGMMAWLKAVSLVSVNNKRVVGFDTFNESLLLKSPSSHDQNELMQNLFEARGFTPSKSDFLGELSAAISSAGYANYKLIQGDVFDSIPKFLLDNPGLRLSLINFDLDIDEPTFFCLEMLWDRLVPGGIAIFDEYGIDEWDESNAVDRFCNKRGLKIFSTGLLAPTAYIVKGI